MMIIVQILLLHNLMVLLLFTCNLERAFKRHQCTTALFAVHSGRERERNAESGKFVYRGMQLREGWMDGWVVGRWVISAAVGGVE